MAHKLVAMGDNCIDLYDKLNQAFPGGNPVNVSVYFSRLGGIASYIGAVGSDEYGVLMKNALTSQGVDVSRVKTLEGKTAVTKVDLIKGNREFGDYDEGVMAHFAFDEEDLPFIAGHDMFVTGIWGKVGTQLNKVKQLGMPIAFDFATKLNDPVVEEIISHVDYAFFSCDEAEGELLRGFMRAMQWLGPKIVTVTLGESGSIAFDGATFYTCGVIPCRVVDTMGAGDSYIAGFLMGILEGCSIEECMLKGTAASSTTIQYLGAW